MSESTPSKLYYEKMNKLNFVNFTSAYLDVVLEHYFLVQNLDKEMQQEKFGTLVGHQRIRNISLKMQILGKVFRAKSMEYARARILLRKSEILDKNKKASKPKTRVKK